MPVAAPPFFVELRRLLVIQFCRDFAERLRAARRFGECDGDGLGAEGAGGQEVDVAFHGKSQTPKIQNPKFAMVRIWESSFGISAIVVLGRCRDGSALSVRPHR